MNKNILICLGVLLLMFLPMAFAWDIEPQTNLVGYWGLDTNTSAIDKHDNTYPGVNTNVYSVTGKIGNAYLYYKSLSSVTTFSATSDLYMAGEVTFAGWIKVGKNNGLNAKCVGQKVANGVYQNYYLCVSGMAGAPYNNVAYFVNARTAGAYQATGATQDLNDGQWHFLVGKGNANGIYIYVDGVLDGFSANANPPAALAVTYPMYFGYEKLSNVFYDLNLDEVGLWSRALSPADITELYNAGNGYTYCTDSGTFGAAGACPAAMLTVSVKDEKTWADLNNVAFTINGVTYISNKQEFDINLGLISAGPTDIVISKTGYTTRHYMWNNNGTHFDLNFTLNPSPISTQFQFKVPNTNIYAANTYVRLDLNGHDSNIWTIGQYLTDAEGKATIPIDANSQRYITSFTYGGSSYRVDPIYLTIEVPKDASTDLNITDSNFNITISNTYNYSYLNRNSQLNTYIVPNTTDYMFVGIDLNDASYAGRTYFLRFDSNDSNRQFLQPYLPSTSTSVNFITKNKTRNTIPYVDFLIYRNINGVKTQVMAGRTDITGSRLFPFTIGENYSIDVFINGVNYESAYLYTATATPVYWYIDTSTGDINIQQYTIETTITFDPMGPKLLGTDNSIDVAMYGDNLTHYYWKIYQYNDLNMMTGKKYYTSNDGVCAGTNCLATIPLPLMDINKSFYIDFNFTNNDINVNTVKIYTRGALSNLDPFRLAFNVRKDMGCSLDSNYPCALGIIISVVLTLILLFIIMKMTGVFFGLGSLVLALFMLGIFTAIGWFYWPLYIFILVGAILAGASGFARGGGNV
jgi:hypothetical protein